MIVAGAEVKKTCSACGECKPLAAGFHRKSASRDGYTNECRDCRNEKNAAWRAENPGYHRQWMEANGFAGNGHQQEKEAQENETPAPYKVQHQRTQGNTSCAPFVRLTSGRGF